MKYEADPQTIDPQTLEWHRHQDRAASNQRPHCGICGRFGRVAGYRCGDIEVARCSVHGEVDAS
jgi:hypothetical protein